MVSKFELFFSTLETWNLKPEFHIHTEYKALKNRINSLIYHSKKNYYTKYFNQYSNNIKKIWVGIKNIINIRTKDHNAPNCIEVGNDIVTDNKQICNNFNDYFTTVADNILKKIKPQYLRPSINIYLNVILIHLYLSHALLTKSTYL